VGDRRPYATKRPNPDVARIPHVWHDYARETPQGFGFARMLVPNLAYERCGGRSIMFSVDRHRNRILVRRVRPTRPAYRRPRFRLIGVRYHVPLVRDFDRLRRALPCCVLPVLSCYMNGHACM
jgi:hypothetical protein